MSEEMIDASEVEQETAESTPVYAHNTLYLDESIDDLKECTKGYTLEARKIVPDIEGELSFEGCSLINPIREGKRENTWDKFGIIEAAISGTLPLKVAQEIILASLFTRLSVDDMEVYVKDGIDINLFLNPPKGEKKVRQTSRLSLESPFLLEYSIWYIENLGDAFADNTVVSLDSIVERANELDDNDKLSKDSRTRKQHYADYVTRVHAPKAIEAL